MLWLINIISETKIKNDLKLIHSYCRRITNEHDYRSYDEVVQANVYLKLNFTTGEDVSSLAVVTINAPSSSPLVLNE